MHIHIILHASFEKPGIIENWAAENNHDVTMTHTYKNEKLPDVSTFDFLVIMGGPQSSLELEKYPYLHNEILLTKQAIEKNKAVLGICLGAQIIGESLGKKPERSPNKEVGVHPIQLTADAHTDPVFKLFPKKFDALHWHSDMPGLAPGSVLLAFSEGCPRQAFRYADRVYGLQCHMEMTNELIQGMVEHCPTDLKPAQYVSSIEELKTIDMTEMNHKMKMILDYLASIIAKKDKRKSSLKDRLDIFDPQKHGGEVMLRKYKLNE